MSYYTPDELVQALKSNGLKVSEYSGWKGRNAGSTYSPECVIVHHTARPQPFPLSIIADGRPAWGGLSAVPGPLYNIVVQQDGTVVLVAYGKSNNSGYGSRKVGDEVRSGVRLSGKTAKERGLSDDKYSLNTYSVGVAVDHPGDGSKMSAVQGEALVKVLVVLAAKFGANRIIGHKEFSERKIDPAFGLSMNDLRDMVRAKAYNPPTTPPAPPTVPPAPEPPTTNPPNTGDTFVAFSVRRALVSRKTSNKHPHVKIAQALLVAYGADIQIDGIFGPNTEKATEAFQKKNKLRVDGVIGANTWAKLEQAS